MRLDYPGCGLSGGSRVRDADGLVEMLNRSCEWFRDLWDAPSITVGGTCRGARLGVSLAAVNPRIDHVVAVSCPVGAHRKPKRRRIRAGVAALEPVGARMTSVLTREIRWKEQRFDLIPGVVEDIVNASHARLTFVYGTADESFAVFTAMMESGELPSDAADRIEIMSREGVQLYGFTKLEDMEWMTDALTELFTEAVSGASGE
jgi:pimeloyl-ACP methyl ester carboxylesterase